MVHSLFIGFRQSGPGQEIWMKSLEFIWVIPKIGVPQNGWLLMESPIKKDDLGGTTLFGNIHMAIFLSKVWHGIFRLKVIWWISCKRVVGDWADIFLEQTQGNRRWNTIISNATNAFGEGYWIYMPWTFVNILATGEEGWLHAELLEFHPVLFFSNQFFNKNPLKIHAPWGMEMCQKASACWKRRHRHFPSDVFCQLHPKWVRRFTVQRPTWGWLVSFFPENNTGIEAMYHINCCSLRDDLLPWSWT